VSFLYFVYGLRLSTNEPFPGLTPLLASSSPRGHDIEVNFSPGLSTAWREAAWSVWFASSERTERGESCLIIWHREGGAGFRMCYHDGVEFAIDDGGRHIEARWADSTTLENAASYLLGPVFGFLLRLQGVTCLHASAIAVGDSAVAIAGPPGAGKSTTAAAFARRGHAVLSDDVVPLLERGGSFALVPAYGSLYLWPDSVKALYGSEEALPRLLPGWDKRHLALEQEGYRFQSEPLPLAAIYLLGERSGDPGAPFVESVAGQTSLISLVANTYANRALDTSMRVQEFEFLGRLVQTVPVRRVRPHRDAARLEKLCEAIIRDFHLLRAGAAGALR
jgi:hypothetical protein